MNFFYKIDLYLNLLKYLIKYKYTKKNKDKYSLFLEGFFNKKKNGLYIDVGCYHPIRMSNTKFLYDKGWHGINLDISKKSIDLFKISRKRDVNLNIGAGDKNELSNAYFQKDLFPTNTMDYTHSKKLLINAVKKKIKVVTLDTVINKYAMNKKIDFIDIDCEGKDLEVLKGLNFRKNKIGLISIEMHGYNAYTRKRGKMIFDIMKKNKFIKIHGHYPGTLIFKLTL
jgi:FkbM family methyltransferase